MNVDESTHFRCVITKCIHEINKLGDEYHILFECTDEKVILNRLKYISECLFKEA